MRHFNQTSLMRCFCQSVKRLTLYAMDSMASKWSLSFWMARQSVRNPQGTNPGGYVLKRP